MVASPLLGICGNVKGPLIQLRLAPMSGTGDWAPNVTF